MTGETELVRCGPQQLGAALEKARPFHAAFLCGAPREKDAARLAALLDPHTVFYTDRALETEPGVKLLIDGKCAQYLPPEQLPQYLEEAGIRFRKGQYGEKLLADCVGTAPGFRGTVSFEGRTGVRFLGRFGREYRTLLNWRTNAVLRPGQAMELWLEYVSAGDVRLELVATLYSGAPEPEILHTWHYDASQKEPLVLLHPEGGILSFSCRAKGKGELMAGPLHIRESRLGSGAFLPGGARFANDSRQEVFSYFDPGDLRPPLVVRFGGFHRAEGFEGISGMKALGTPFLLIEDMRLEGGAGFLGSYAYEWSVEMRIRECLARLHMDVSQLVFTGSGLGALGACCFAARLRPRAVVIGKPLVSLGTIASNTRLLRPDRFEAALDILRFHTGGCSAQDAEKLDRWIWEQIGAGDPGQTEYAVAYMRQDDYDPDAYDRLLACLSERRALIYGKGVDGRHDDRSQAVTAWMDTQMKRLLKERFGREGA